MYKSLSGDGNQALRSVVMHGRAALCVSHPPLCSAAPPSITHHPVWKAPPRVLVAHVSSCGRLHLILGAKRFL